MRRLLVLLALALSVPVLPTTPASAGGPTSVLVTDPTSDRATALYHSDPRYPQLDGLLAGGERLDGPPALLGDRAITLTWMVHDVSPWRFQQLYVDAEGGPVLATRAEVGSGPTTWTRPADAQALLLLTDGLLGSGAPSPPAASAAPAPDPVTIERTVTETTWWSLAGWRWGVLGLLLGAGGALLVTSATRGRSREREPRQVLVDAAP